MNKVIHFHLNDLIAWDDDRSTKDMRSLYGNGPFHVVGVSLKNVQVMSEGCHPEMVTIDVRGERRDVSGGWFKKVPKARKRK